MIRRLLLALTARLPVEEVSHQGEKFMERYYVGTWRGWRFYIHRFIASDPDCVHDHPWRRGYSLILSGWYIEEKRERRYVRKWINAVHGDTFHRVVIPFGGEAWTLFAHDSRCKSWGFLRPISFHADTGGVTFFGYEPLTPEPGHSDWHLRAPKGRDIGRVE